MSIEGMILHATLPWTATHSAKVHVMMSRPLGPSCFVHANERNY